MRQVLGSFLSEFYHVSLAPHGRAALDQLDKKSVDLLLLIDELPGAVSARELIRTTQNTYPDLPIVVLSRESMTREARVVRVGSCSFVSHRTLRTEIGRAQLLLIADRRIREQQQERQTFFQRRQHQRSGLTAAHFLVGRSAAIEALREQTLQASRSNLNVLITGETGVGKTLVAQAVHFAGEHGGSRPYITLDPSTLVPSLFESELFGHVRGAFTGATGAQVGAFEAANGGSLLLDEIGDLPIDLQRKLLQAVEERVIRRVGDVREIELNVRLLAATNRNLERDVEQGRFRADLFQRLNETRMHIPPVRERLEDVPLLLCHFLGQFNAGRMFRVSAPAEHMLSDYHWPGNVREVRTLARRLTAEGAPDEIREEDLVQVLPARLDRTDGADLPVEERIRVFSRRAYLKALADAGYNIRGAARALDVPYHTLRSRLKTLGLLEVVSAHRNK
jgi:DNA-binding NtrC family response regulator